MACSIPAPQGPAALCSPRLANSSGPEKQVNPRTLHSALSQPTQLHERTNTQIGHNTDCCVQVADGTKPISEQVLEI